jgi:hypothetical protein
VRSRLAGGTQMAFRPRSRRCGPGCRRIDRRPTACSAMSWLQS